MGWILLVVVSAVAIWWLWPRARPRRRPPTKMARTSGTYHCVSIRHRSDGCEVAIKLKDWRFLSKEAPSLPLPGCNAERCRCQYVHHRDRRVDDRRSPIGPAHLGGPDRRSGNDRRRLQHVA